jgi:hypothetical protein
MIKMPSVPSLISLHLQYRLWIAEMNFDINIIRIYNDYLQELRLKAIKPAGALELDKYEKDLLIIRADIDELRNEMHLGKMKLANYVRKENVIDAEQTEEHSSLIKRYSDFRNKFAAVKTELNDLAAKVLPSE